MQDNLIDEEIDKIIEKNFFLKNLSEKLNSPFKTSSSIINAKHYQTVPPSLLELLGIEQKEL